MILRERPSGLRLFLALRGSVLPRILPALVVNIVIATLVTWSHGDLFQLKITLTTIPFTLIGLPISSARSARARNRSGRLNPSTNRMTVWVSGSSREWAR